MTSPSDALLAIFAADRSLRQHETLLLEAAPAALRKVLSTAVREAKALPDRDEAIVRLERLADLCAQVSGPEMTDALIAILDDESESVRVQAGEALADVGFERYAELARGIERALDRNASGPSMGELPWILCEIAEPSATALIARFLRIANVEIVASAVEALAELGDPAAITHLKPLVGDAREIEIDDGGESLSATLGDLVSETIESLQGDA
jgi:HEAT repeat protein